VIGGDEALSWQVYALQFAQLQNRSWTCGGTYTSATAQLGLNLPPTLGRTMSEQLSVIAARVQVRWRARTVLAPQQMLEPRGTMVDCIDLQSAVDRGGLACGMRELYERARPQRRPHGISLCGDLQSLCILLFAIALRPKIVDRRKSLDFPMLHHKTGVNPRHQSLQLQPRADRHLFSRVHGYTSLTCDRIAACAQVKMCRSSPDGMWALVARS